MQIRRKKLLAMAALAATILGLALSELPPAGGHNRALAAVSLGCQATLNISPTTSGTFSTPTSPTTITLSVANGLDSNAQVFLAIYDASGRSASLIPLDSATVSATGSYQSKAELPAGGIAGGSDQIVVADYGPSCASAPFTINPQVSVSPNQGQSVSFNSSGFHAGASVTVTFTDAKGAQFTLGSVSASYLGVASGLAMAIPTGAAVGTGSLSFDDHAGGAVSNISFTYTGVPPTATPCALCPTNTPVPSSTTGPGGTATNTPFAGPFPTSTPPPGSTSTPVPFVSSTSTWTPVPGATATWTPLPGNPNATSTPNLTFPSPTNTPFIGFPSPTPVHVVSTPAAECRGRPGTVVDGDFANGLTCWNAAPGSAVAVQPVAGKGAAHAARVSAAANMGALSQTFTSTAASRSVLFYYQNLAKPALAQLSDSGGVLVGRRLLPTKAGTFALAVLPIPDGLPRGDAITVQFIAQKGTLLVHGVTTSKYPTGTAPPAPAQKPKAQPPKKKKK